MNIELTPEQSQTLSAGGGESPVVIDPRTGQSYRLIRAEDYERLQRQHYDDSPWTAAEMATLAGAAFSKLDDDDYGHYPREER
jgi:hypothetical protein